jgi:hypothetical protein
VDKEMYFKGRRSCVAQGDVLLAEQLRKSLTKPDGRCSLVATFIHRVVPTLETLSSLRSRKSNKAAWLAAWRDHNIFFNRTPIGMAAQVLHMHSAACQLPLCSVCIQDASCKLLVPCQNWYFTSCKGTLLLGELGRKQIRLGCILKCFKRYRIEDLGQG